MTGKEAEEYVAEKLRAAGWIILARNFRYIGCELDIVAKKGTTLIIVEVKHRQLSKTNASSNESSQLNVNFMESLLPNHKKKALWRGANIFLCRTKIQCQTIRFDLALLLERRQKKSPDGPGLFELKYFVNILPQS